jgi:murein DD-endopeptidase MepM/ murein hydrolase activator NlpD
MTFPEPPQENHKSPHLGHWILTLLFFLLAIFAVGRNASDFHASVIPTRQAAPFDGTTMPIISVPKWTSLTQILYKAPYDQIPADKLIPIPVYDPAVLKTPTEQLGWKTESDLAIRNAKITYSVVYMGNYKLDGIEYAGGHLAVDIKVPDGTPVYAIANGIVDKVAEQSTGFGNHIVIKHENFPSLENASAKTTIYSSYNHLSQVLVAEGDVVAKGQLIGKSGHTGTATTPHVHFQIDNDQAPWHPYWPFTYLEANAAGVSFWDAINIGLNADKAKQTTINPLLYVQKYLNGKPASVTSPANTTPANTTPTNTTPAVVPNNTTTNTTVTTPAPTQEPPTNQNTNSNTQQSTVSNSTPATAFRIESDETFVKNAPETLTVTAVDSAGSVVESYTPPKDVVNLQIMVGGANIPQTIRSSDFINGVASVQITPTADYGLQIRAFDGVVSGESNIMKSVLFSDVNDSSGHLTAITFLKNHGVIGGYPDGTFKPQNVVSRVEALKFILGGANARIITGAKLPFTDAKSDAWYSDYVATGFSKNIIKGYPDSTFKPANTVSRAEFIKMLVVALELKIDLYVTRDPFKDVPKDAWYSLYAKYAKDKNLIEVTGDRFRPDEGMTREDVSETLYRAIMFKVSGADKYSPDLSVSSTLLNKYFS